MRPRKHERHERNIEPRIKTDEHSGELINHG